MDRLETLKETRSQAKEAAEALIVRLDKVLTEEKRAWTETESEELRKAEDYVKDLDKQIKKEEKRAEEATNSLEKRDETLGAARQVGGATVTNAAETLTYGPGNPGNSWYRDVLSSQGGFRGSSAALARLEQHEKEMDAIRTRASNAAPEHRTLARYDREARRAGLSGPEFRTVEGVAGATVSLSGAAEMAPFSPPVFFLDQYAPFRTYGRTLINNLKSFPMPDTGMAFYVPKVTQPTEASNQATENTTVSTQDIVSQYNSGTLQTIVNNLNVSQQYLDRVGPGIEGDMIVHDDQTRQLNRALNLYAWNTLLTSGISTVSFTNTTSTYSGVSKFNEQNVADYKLAIHKGNAAIRKTDGVVAYPTHFFTDADVWESIAGSYDTNGRPFIVPQGVAFNPLASGDPNNAPEGFTGFSFGTLPTFADQALNVAASASGFAGSGATSSGSNPFDVPGGNHVGVLGAFDIAVYWLEGLPVLRVLPQPGAAQLQVLIQQYVYCALVPVYLPAVVAISSGGTASSVLGALTA